MSRLTRSLDVAMYLRSIRSDRVASSLLGHRRPRVPFLFECHALAHRDPEAEVLTPPEQRRVERLETTLIREADGVVANGPLTGEDVRSFSNRPSLPLAVIPNAGPTECPPQGERDLDAVYVGSLHPWKGLEIVLDALARLDSIRLAIAGGGEASYEGRLRSQVEKLRLGARVEFLGPVSRTRALSLLARAKVALVPLAEKGLSAQRYTCPIKLLESLRLGTPALVADRPAVRALLESAPGHRSEAIDSVVFDSFRDASKLARNLDELMADSNRRHKLALRSANIGRSWTWELRGARVIRFAEYLLEASREATFS